MVSRNGTYRGICCFLGVVLSSLRFDFEFVPEGVEVGLGGGFGLRFVGLEVARNRGIRLGAGARDFPFFHIGCGCLGFCSCLCCGMGVSNISRFDHPCGEHGVGGGCLLRDVGLQARVDEMEAGSEPCLTLPSLVNELVVEGICDEGIIYDLVLDVCCAFFGPGTAQAVRSLVVVWMVLLMTVEWAAWVF